MSKTEESSPTTGELQTTPSQRFHAEVRQHARHNWYAHVVEGGLYMGGLAFVSSDSVLPALVESLGGPTWVIAFMPTAMFMGFSLPPLLTAHWVERLRRTLPFLLTTGVFQRLAYLMPGLVLWFLPEGHDLLVLSVVALAPFLSGISGGISSCAWQELVARTVPPQIRSGVWATRQVIQTGIGIAAGGVIAWVLAEWPGRQGYAILHFILFGFLLGSYIVFTLIREVEVPEKHMSGQRGLIENLRSLPALLAADVRLRHFAGTTFFGAGFFIALPFLAIHACDTASEERSFVGWLVMAQMIGGVFGNILLGWAGNRHGGRLVLIIGQVAFLLVGALSLVLQSAPAFLGIFFLVGVAMAAHMVGKNTLGIDLCPLERRPTYLALIQTTGFLSMLWASGMGALLKSWSGNYASVAVASVLSMGAALGFVLRIREPRAEMTENGAVASPVQG